MTNKKKGSKGLAHKKNGNTTQKIFSIVLV